MVWWIDNFESTYCRQKYSDGGNSMVISKDRIFQTTSIMFNLDDGCYDPHDIKFLTTSGVNIFNIDRTIYGEDVFQMLKEAIIASNDLHEMYPDKYYRPLGLAVTMTITKLIDIDDRVDLIILKDVKNLEGLLEFKKHYRNKKSVLIMPWIETKNMIDLNQIIKFSDGLVIDDSNRVEENCCKINLCKQAFKPVFYAIKSFIEDYTASSADERKVFVVANKIVTDKLDGVILLDNNKEVRGALRRGLVKSLVIAIDIVENANNNKDSYKLSTQPKIPLLPPKSMALSACLAAKLSGASAIIVLTSSGSSARLVANGAPPCYILAITTRKETARRLHLYRKVIPLLYNHNNNMDWQQERWNRIQFCTSAALQIGICLYQAKVVILAPSSEEIGYCNSLQIISMPLKCDNIKF